MDRNKQNVPRSGKSKIGAPHHGSEIFALGSKSSASSSNRDDGKSKVMSSTSASKSSSVSDRKREATSSLSSNSTAKKPKLPNLGGGSSSHSTGYATSGRTSDGSGSNSLEYWEQVALECDASELVQSVLTAIDRQDSDQVVALLCGAVKSLAMRAKMESALTLSLLYLAKVRPSMFCNEVVTSALLSILRRDSQHSFKGRNNPSTHILAANLLARGYHNKMQWPETFIRYYIDDAINERVWVDYDECSAFVENICTAFGTKTPPKSMLQPELNALSTILVSSREATDEDSGEGNTSGGNSDALKSGENQIICSVQPRYNHIKENIEKLAIDTVKEQFNRRQAPDCSTRNFLKFLATVSGISEVRAMAVTRLELWIHNGKLMKPAQELLTYICYNVTSHSARDHEVLANLVKMRLKTKALINIYMSCIREMINLQPDILFIVLKNVVQNELSNARNPNNLGMGMLASIFQTKPDESARHLAAIYQEFLLQREDCLRTLRVFLRELVKLLRYDIKLTVFCQAFLMTSPAIVQQIENFEFRDRVFSATVDLVCLCMFLSVSPQIREANVLLRAGRETKGNKILVEYYDQMTRIQCEAVKWMFDIVPTLFKSSEAEYTQSLHKILLLDTPEQYTKGDQWPPEQERALLLRLVSEIPLHQDTIVYLALIGINKEIPVKIPDAMEVIEQVIRRSAGLKINDYPALHADKLDIIDFLFTMAEYHHPENIALPIDYEPPKLAISTLYWKAWNILLMLSAHNPSTFGAFCWEQYPMLRNLMEMCITNQFANYKVPDEELQVGVLEKTQILEFETHLAAATSKVIITEQNSLLLSQLILMDPMGVARRPPLLVLEMLQNQNATLKLGHLLCRSRKPDLLLDIIQRQGTSQSMPWLADLVQNSEGDFNHLPVQCLCEFLLSNSLSMDNHRDVELLKYLQNLLADHSSDHQISCEVLEYFLRRLTSPITQSRVNAIKGLQLLLNVFRKDDEDIQANHDESNWLLHYLPMIPHFPAVRLIAIVQLRAACRIENNAELVMTYIQFIAANTLLDPGSDMFDHVMDLSQLVVERNTLFSCIMPMEELDENRLQTLNCMFVMFNNYVIKLKEHKAPFNWPEYPDLVMVHFQDGTQQPIHLIVIQAFIILLTYSSMIPNSTTILDYWFPPNVSLLQAFTIETSEPVLVFPDWLKLKMIRSSVEQLVNAALQDLTPDQIVLFIQNFGIPVNPMSKLLALLDLAVIEQTDAVKAAIVNTVYLAQLIEIQQARGVKNGHIAIETLELNENVCPDAPKQEIVATEQLEISFNKKPIPVNSSQTKEIEEVLDVVLHTPTMSNVHLIRFRRLIQQMLTTDGQHHLAKQQQNTTSKVLQYLNRIAKSQHGQYFYRSIVQNTAACSLFRTLFVSVQDKSSNYNCLVGIIDHCIQVMNTENCPMLFQILFNKRKNYIKSVKEAKHVEKQDLVQVLHTTNLTELQTKGNHLLNELLKNKSSPENLVDVITTVLKSPSNVKQEIAAESDKNGLLIDWLADMDSELMLSTRNNQLDLLFNRSLPQFRFYLLSLLSHQASWSTLHSTVFKVLETFNDEFDSTSVIHFIAALIRNPKLWQGREKNTSKHYRIEYVLALDEKQLTVLTDYILSENSMDTEKLSSRVNILLQCVPAKIINIKSLVSYVRNCERVSDVLKKQFLQQLYLNIPPMKFMVVDLNEVYLANATKLTGCETDKVTNITMTVISSLSIARDFQAMSQNMELLLRKLAASHPSLFLRQISMLATLLQGRAHMDLHVLRSAYHIPLFIQVFGILEILQPQIFENSYKKSLHLALECYFALFQYHGTTKDTFDLMYRFMEFLQIYTQKDAANAWKFIEPHTDLIEDLAADNRVIVPLQQLVQGVSLMKYKHVKRNDSDDVVSSQSNTNTGASAVILTPYTKTLNQTLTKLLGEVQRRNGEEVLAPLQELEIITTKRRVPLESIHERLLMLISTSTLSIRYSAYNLLIRHLKSNPGNISVNSNTLAVYVQCLRNKDTAVVISALEFLTEMVICLQEYSSEILRNVFEMGIKSKMNTFEHIRRCVLALKTQHAC